MNLNTTHNKEIINALPHKTPFVMVDELLYMDTDKVKGKLTIKENNIFVKDGYFQEPGIIEHVAQVVGLKPTLEALQQGLSAPLGYFATINNFKLYKLPKVNSDIETTIINEVVVKTAIKVNTKSESAGELICKSQMLFYLKT